MGSFARLLVTTSICFGLSPILLGKSYNSGELSSSLAGPPLYSMGEFEDLVRRLGHLGPAAIISALPEQLKKNHLLVPESLSSQAVATSSDFPRVLLVADPRFVVAYGGDPAHPQSRQIEVIAFNEATEKFDFYAFGFRGALERLENPEVCNACHQGAPIWDSHPMWPGVLGSNDRVNADAEKALFDRLRAKFPYAQIEPPSNLAELERGNARFTNDLVYLNSKYLARSLMSAPLFSRYRLALYAALFDSQDFEKELVPDEREGFRDEAKRLERRIQVQLDELYDQRAQRTRNPQSRVPLVGELTEAQMLRSVRLHYLFDRMSLRAFGLSITSPRVPYDFSNAGIENSAYLLREMLLRDVLAPAELKEAAQGEESLRLKSRYSFTQMKALACGRQMHLLSFENP